MIIEKVLNNSTVIITDEGTEAVLLGKGIGFNKKRGDEVDTEKIEKKYVVESGTSFNKSIYSLDDCYFTLSKDIIDIAEAELGTELNKTSYILLADHISFSINRFQKGISTPNLLMNEIQVVYPKQYKIGIQAREYIHNETGVLLPKDEIGFIALHIVNSMMDSDSDILNKLPEIIEKIVKIIETYYQVTFDKETIEFSRFLTHIRYMLLRLQRRDIIANEFDGANSSETVKNYEVINKVEEYVSDIFHKSFSIEERYYLNLHLNRMLD